ncbi:hypothetical protein ACFX13_038795 [Malus domestica]
MYQLESGRGPLGVIEYTALLGRFDREKQKLRGQFVFFYQVCDITERDVHFMVKSLVMQGNGCNAFDANGEVVYQVDNYDNKHIDEVHLMDLRGNLLLTTSMHGWDKRESNRLLAIAEMAN